MAALSRDAVEQDLAFLGLIVFRNELKPDSRDAILALKKGYVRPVMVTGDNAQASNFQCLCITYYPGTESLQQRGAQLRQSTVPTIPCSAAPSVLDPYLEGASSDARIMAGRHVLTRHSA